MPEKYSENSACRVTKYTPERMLRMPMMRIRVFADFVMGCVKLRLNIVYLYCFSMVVTQYF